MARSSAADVRDVADIDSGVNLTPYVNEANAIVDQRLSGAGLDSSLLTKIETRVAAHLASLGKAPRVTDAGEGGSSVTFELADAGDGLRETRHGRVALALDPTGNLDDSSDDFTKSIGV